MNVLAFHQPSTESKVVAFLPPRDRDPDAYINVASTVMKSFTPGLVNSSVILGPEPLNIFSIDTDSESIAQARILYRPTGPLVGICMHCAGRKEKAFSNRHW
jgi:hypothetical protein